MVRGLFLAGDLAWHEGLDAWTPLYEVLHARFVPRDETAGAGDHFTPITASSTAGLRHNLHLLWRSFCSFVDGYLDGRAVLGLVIVSVLASWIYPPWTWRGEWHWGFILGESEGRIDFGRLALLDALTVGLGLSLFWIVGRGAAARVRVAVFLLASLLVLAGTCSFQPVKDWFEWRAQVAKAEAARERVLRLAHLRAEEETRAVELVRRERAAKFNPDTYLATTAVATRGNTTVATPSSSQLITPAPAGIGAIGHLRKASDFPSAAKPIGNVLRLSASPKDPLNVAVKPTREHGTNITPEAMKQIAVFDVNVVRIGDTFVSYIDGRIRNSLSRQVSGVEMKAAFYNGGGELIEVVKLRPNILPIAPAEPVGFHVLVGKSNMPKDATCTVEVVAAFYSPDL